MSILVSTNRVPTRAFQTWCGVSALRLSLQRSFLEVELQHELNEPGVVARRNDSPEITWTENLASIRVELSPGGDCGVQVADRIGKVHLIEQVEEFRAKFDISRF